MNQPVKSITLENKTDGHSKEYRLSLEDVGGGTFEVVALWGKIGSSLTRTVKCSADRAQAEKEYEKILRGQLNKGYIQVAAKDDGQTAATAGFQSPVVRTVIAKVLPMLCGPLKELSELEPFMLNDRYVLEEKFNGTRKEVMKHGDVLSITNKRGQPTAKGMLPKTQAAFLGVPFDFTVDTEDEPVGGGCVLLDILAMRGKPLDRLPRKERRPILEAFYKAAGFDPQTVRLAEEARGQANKRVFLKRIQKAKGEGVIVKDDEAIYYPGESGRAHCWKWKFQATASFIVHAVGVGGKRNVALALLDGKSQRVLCGKCAIPVNQNFEEINVGDVIECRYIYAEAGSHSLNQPFYLGKRDDVKPAECQITQLKYKPQTVSEGGC